MSQIFSGLIAYIEERRYGNDFYTPALQQNDVLPFVQSVGMFLPNVKEDTIKLPNLSAVAGIADGATCITSFDNGNDSTISQSSIALKKGVIADSICPHDGFETYYTAAGMAAGQKYDNLGVFETGILREIQRAVAKRIAQNAWNGEGSPDTWTFSGWREQLLAAVMGAGIVGTGTPTAGGSAGTDAAGAYNILVTLINAAMADVDFASDVEAGNVYFVMSPQDKEFLRQNYVKLHGTAFPDIAVGLQGLQNDIFAPTLFPGTKIPIYLQSSLTGSATIIMSRKGNQVLAADTVSDFTDLDMWLADDHETLRWKFRFKYGVGWRALNSANVKYWGPTT